MIPYCAFATGLSELSADVDEENVFPLCDKFTPVLLEGQLCYQLNVSEHISKEVSFGPNHALMLLVDNNPEKSASVLPDGNLNGEIEYFFFPQIFKTCCNLQQVQQMLLRSLEELVETPLGFIFTLFQVNLYLHTRLPTNYNVLTFCQPIVANNVTWQDIGRSSQADMSSPG